MDHHEEIAILAGIGIIFIFLPENIFSMIPVINILEYANRQALGVIFLTVAIVIHFISRSTIGKR